jgi:hypothetical protein
MKVIKFTRVDFDNLENHHLQAIGETVLGYYAKPDGMTTFGVMADIINKLNPIKVYMGWDGVLYPRLNMEEIEVK